VREARAGDRFGPVLADASFIGFIPVSDLGARPFTIAGWRVPDIGAEVRTLTDKGVQFTRYDGMAHDDLGVWTAPSGDQIAWFTDPDGNTLSLTAFAPEGTRRPLPQEPALYCRARLVEGPDEVFAVASAVLMQDIGAGGDARATLHVRAGTVDEGLDLL
jgi:hypothetical protein